MLKLPSVSPERIESILYGIVVTSLIIAAVFAGGAIAATIACIIPILLVMGFYKVKSPRRPTIAAFIALITVICFQIVIRVGSVDENIVTARLFLVATFFLYAGVYYTFRNARESQLLEAEKLSALTPSAGKALI